MATIRKQSILSSLFIYAGFAIGAINVIFLFKWFFTPQQFGLTRILMDIALIFTTICTAGTVTISIKFYPFYKYHLEKKKNDLLTMVFILVGLFCTALYFILPILQPWVLRNFAQRSPEMINYFHLVLPLTISLVMFTMLEGFAWNIQKTVASNFLKEFLYRMLTSLLIGFWAWGLITDFSTWMNFFSSLYFVSGAVLIFILYRSKEYSIQFKPSKVTKRLGPMMLRFGSAYFVSAILNIVAKTNDTLIIASQSTGGLADAAIFTIATYLITAMDVPQRSVVAAATPQIALAWRDNDMAKLDRLYKKTALNLLIASSFIFGLIMVNQPVLMKIMGPQYGILPTLMLVLGTTKIIDLGTGLNSQILQLSKNWRIDLFTNMFFVFLSILLNYMLTKRYGLMGTAVGGLIAMISFNLIRFIYIKRIYNLQPFSWRNAAAACIAGGLILLVIQIPTAGHFIIDGIIRTFVFVGVFAILTIRLNISEDITDLYRITMEKIRSMGKKGL